jgi:Ser/Thr protein kinase RdoA (MazF antagonist)
VSPSLDEQAVQVAGLLTVPDRGGAGLPRRLGDADAWLVQCGPARIVLKLGRSEQDEADVTWEHDYLRRLAGSGFPASVPVPAFDGRSWVQVDGRVWAALSFLPGRPLVAQSDPDMAAAGALVARYHQAARTIPLVGQRPTAAELMNLIEATRWDHLRAALGDVGKVGRLLAMLMNLESDLRRLKFAEIEHLVIHGDPTNDNLIVDGSPPRVVGLIDFGSAHVAPWIFDLAAGLWRSGRPDPNGVAHDPERIRRFVVGYHGVSPLPRVLARAIPLLMEARGYQLISRRVRRLPPQAAGAPMPSVLDALVRTEWLRAHRDEIDDVILGALAGERPEDDRDG